jgi:hypothetical protein
MTSVRVIVPAKAPVGIQFEWTGELVVKAILDDRRTGIEEGMVLVSINGNELEGWSFSELVGAMKVGNVAFRATYALS